MIRVVGYLAGAPNPLAKNYKLDILRDIVRGVNKVGDKGSLQSDRKLLTCDVAVLQGWVHAQSDNVAHLNFRKNIITRQLEDNNHTLIADSNMFNYRVGKQHPSMYHRWSLDGVFPTTGCYFDKHINPNRWKQISEDLDIPLRRWRKDGTHILICCQRNGGWSMKGLTVPAWLKRICKEIRTHTDRPIIIRPHPGDKRATTYLRELKHDLKTKHKISFAPSIVDDLKNAWATITYNSSPGVASAIEGVPVFVTDPIPATSQSFPIANTILSEIENPKMPDRQTWLENLSMCHWNKEELRNGTAWKHIRKFL